MVPNLAGINRNHQSIEDPMLKLLLNLIFLKIHQFIYWYFKTSPKTSSLIRVLPLDKCDWVKFFLHYFCEHAVLESLNKKSDTPLKKELFASVVQFQHCFDHCKRFFFKALVRICFLLGRQAFPPASSNLWQTVAQ